MEPASHPRPQPIVFDFLAAFWAFEDLVYMSSLDLFV
jgi:hypothetical protein